MHRYNILADASELQGILCGMLAGGMDPENPDWKLSLQDFINAGEPLNSEVASMTVELYEQLCQQLQGDEFSLVLCIPEEGAPISERGQSLIAWVQGFMLGFGVQQQELKSCSEDVKEALQDFSDIIHMDSDMPENEESEQALFEVLEYVRISAMLCFSELGHHSSKGADGARVLH
ncbi:UPF0149 family protein [Alteromonas sp. a30]|nr:UPF0149 family protein [Alteromonas sp. a30]